MIGDLHGERAYLRLLVALCRADDQVVEAELRALGAIACQLEASLTFLDLVRDVDLAALVEQSCPYCHDGIAGHAAADLLTCGGCGVVFHRACIGEARNCATLGCRNRRRSPEARRA